MLLVGNLHVLQALLHLQDLGVGCYQLFKKMIPFDGNRRKLFFECRRLCITLAQCLIHRITTTSLPPHTRRTTARGRLSQEVFQGFILFGHNVSV